LETGASSSTPGKTKKIGAAGGGVPNPPARRNRKVKAAGATDQIVEMGKQLRKDRFDLVTDPVVIGDIGVPVDAAIGQ
jgi:hypothetical protein